MKTAFALLSVVAAAASATQFAPAAGSTLFNLGQNYADEWDAFSSADKLPAGISVYGDIYGGALNSDSQNLLKQYAGAHSGGHVEIGMSWKDDMQNHGYTQYQGAQLCNDIAAGKFDATISALAKYLAGFPNMKYLLRVDYEVSGNLHANTDPSGFDSATFDLTAYPKAFAHVRKVFLGVLPNVDFVYHAVRGEAALLYPGDDVVDWNGFSIFNNDVCLPVGNTANCDGFRVDPNLIKDIQWAPKPKIVAESAVQPPAGNDPKSFIEYLTRLTSVIEDNNFAAWTYINSNWPARGWSTNTWTDSRIESNPLVEGWFNQNVASQARYIFG